MKYHYIHKNQEKFINEHEYWQTLKKIDESYGVTLGLSRVINYCKNIFESCVCTLEFDYLFPNRLTLETRMETKHKNIFVELKNDVIFKENGYYQKYTFVFTLSNCGSRLEWIDFDNSKLTIVCNLFETEQDYEKIGNGGSISSNYKFISNNNNKEGYVIGNIDIEADLYPSLENNNIKFITYVANYKINDFKNIIPLLQHEFNHIHKKIKMNTNQNITDSYDIIINLLRQQGRGSILWYFADSLYRYCIQDELNANVEQAFREYQIIKDITKTDTWISSEIEKKFFTEHYNINNHLLNKRVYDTFSEVGKKLLKIKDLNHLKNPITEKEINLRNKLFVKALIKKILQNIDKLQERIKRTTKVPIDEKWEYCKDIYRQHIKYIKEHEQEKFNERLHFLKEFYQL